MSKGVPFDNTPFFTRYEKKISKSAHIIRKTPKMYPKLKKFVAPNKKI